MRSSFAANGLLVRLVVARLVVAGLLASGLLASFVGSAAVAADCPGNPGALGTSRTIAVDPTEHRLVGSFQYRESLPLNDHEVVITFDDGPLPPYTSHILDTLARECVKATFFMVGRMAHSYPHLVKRVYAEGHTIANHSQNHPFTFNRMSVERAAHEIEDGRASIRAALGDPNGVSDFFRIPGLLRQTSVENYLSSRGYMTWSVDFMADDWTHISASEIVHRALQRLEHRGRGILLLHDIQPATALGLPMLLHQLKARGFKIVHVVEAGPKHPKTATLPEQWQARRAPTVAASYWPPVHVASLALPAPALSAPGIQSFGIANASGAYEYGVAHADRLRAGDHDIELPSKALWRHGVRLVSVSSAKLLPAPDASNFHYSRVWKPHQTLVRRKLGTHRRKLTASTRLPKTASPKHHATSKSVSSKSVSHKSVLPKRASSHTSKNHTAPRPSRPVGHQLQLPKPTASLLQPSTSR